MHAMTSAPAGRLVAGGVSRGHRGWEMWHRLSACKPSTVASEQAGWSVTGAPLPGNRQTQWEAKQALPAIDPVSDKPVPNYPSAARYSVPRRWTAVEDALRALHRQHTGTTWGRLGATKAFRTSRSGVRFSPLPQVPAFSILRIGRLCTPLRFWASSTTRAYLVSASCCPCREHKLPKAMDESHP